MNDALAGFVLARKLSVLCIPMGLGCSVALTTSGFVLQVGFMLSQVCNLDWPSIYFEGAQRVC